MRIPILSTIVVIAAAVTMAALGVWQLGRADEKAEMIARYDAALGDPQPTFGSPSSPENAFRRIETYCAGDSMTQPVSGRALNGSNGWSHVVLCEIGGPDPARPLDEQAPDFVIETGRVMLGWSRAPEPIEWRGGMISGTIVPNRDGGGTIVADPPLAGLEPLAKPDPGDLPNNHLAYAGQWFFFALTALVIYFLALRSRSTKLGRKSS